MEKREREKKGKILIIIPSTFDYCIHKKKQRDAKSGKLEIETREKANTKVREKEREREMRLRGVINICQSMRQLDYR